MSKKKYKVIVVGLPKTGTSTLTVMLRMLNYTVTGPDIEYKYGDFDYLDQKFKEFDAFQDFPWCFEWQRYLYVENVKVIILNRNQDSWWKSFYESYGRKEENYLSYPYMNIPKLESNNKLFLNYFEEYYTTANEFAKKFPDRVLIVNIKSFNWSDLCGFLGEKIPRNVFGNKVRKPHVNKKNIKTRNSQNFIIINKIKKRMISSLGKNNYNKVIIFLRKNNII